MLLSRLAYLAVATGLLASCTDAGDSGEPSAPNQLQGDDKADGGPLWAGLTSITLERYTSDPCSNGAHALGDAPVIYDDWARTRAEVRNICFEVWQPGVTDWDNPDFWQQLDVRAYYRFGHTGAFESTYVNSIDRRGNNRRYAFSLDYSLDPTINVGSVAAMQVPFSILNESASSSSEKWAYVSADLEIYFTVNGRILKSPSNKSFTISYQNYLREPTLAPQDAGYVLHDIVTCDQGAARFGSGAGFFAADIRDAAGIADLASGLDGSLIYGAAMAKANSGVLSMIYSNQVAVAGETLPGFSSSTGLLITPSGSTMRVDIDVYDRALGATRVVSHTFTGCAQ
jgi:hypothetical protein